MTIKSLITDPKTGIQASVVDGGEENAVAVATRELKSYTNKIKFFTNFEYGYNMNIATEFSGALELIHNGTDNVYWTASSISGVWDFDSTDQAHTGTRSIDATRTYNDNTAQIAKGSTITLSGVAITGWIYLSSWDDRGTKGIHLYGWDTSTSTVVGNEVNLKNYIDIGSMGNWQKFVVSLSDMNLVGETIDAIRIKTVDIGTGVAPNYYLDDIQIEGVGTPVEFKIEPNSNTWLHVNTYSILLVDAYSPVLTDSTMPYFSYDKLLGVATLINGILYRRVVNYKIPLAFPFRNLSEILMFPGARIESYGSDGTNTFLKILVDLKEPIVLKSETKDKISFILSDDLSGLLKLVISANCKEEQR
jgi:hypothetical protein